MPTAHNYDLNPRQPDGTVYCWKHKKIAYKGVSRTSNNPGRTFYRCGKPRDDPGRCDFFVWADEIPENVDLGLNHNNSGGKAPFTVSSPPRPPKDNTQLMTPRTPSKDLTESQRARRLAAIETGAAEHGSSQAHGSLPPSSPLAPFSSSPQATRHSQPSRDGIFTQRVGNSRTPGKSLQATGSDEDEYVNVGAINEMDEEEMRTLAAVRLGASSALPQSISRPTNHTTLSHSASRRDSVRRMMGEDEEEEEAELEEPMPGGFYGHARRIEPVNTTPRRMDKGKQRENVQTTPSVSEATRNLSSFSAPTVNSTIIRKMIDQLSGMETYTKTLERRVEAANKSNFAKSERIQELELRIQQLEEELEVYGRSQASQT